VKKDHNAIAMRQVSKTDITMTTTTSEGAFPSPFSPHYPLPTFHYFALSFSPFPFYLLGFWLDPDFFTL
jgi:hypothetical protein